MGPPTAKSRSLKPFTLAFMALAAMALYQSLQSIPVIPEASPASSTAVSSASSFEPNSRLSWQSRAEPHLAGCVSDRSSGYCHLIPCPGQEAHNNVSTAYRGGYYRRAERGTQMTIPGVQGTDADCALSRKYNFLYVHNLKAGGTTIKHFIQHALCNNTLDCHDPHVLQLVTCSEAIQQYPDVFVWSFVRNPYTRFYSMFAMADYMRKDPDKPIDFQTFAKGNMLVRHSLTNTHLSHFVPQSTLLFDQSSLCPTLDFVGRLEHIDHDMRIVLDIVQSPELEAFYRANGNQVEKSDSTAFGSRKKSSFTLADALSDPMVHSALANEYFRDFYIFGYNPRVLSLSHRR